MRLRRVRLENLRAFAALDLGLERGWNLFLGPNGAGKTTLLEAAYLLSHARSFRAGAKDALVRRGEDRYSVYGTVEYAGGSALGVGLARESGGFEARIGGEPVILTELLRRVAVACFEPGSHELISGPADGRRRFLDWGVFHVEHTFLRVWRAFQRALRQRNALLRAGGSSAELEPWDLELARSGAELAELRRRCAARLGPVVSTTLRDLLGELGAAEFRLDSAWSSEAEALEQLALGREDDRRRGFTMRGPHRTDWSIAFEGAPRREHLSRGQEKLCALGCILSQAKVFAAEQGEWPIVCIDDLASELDIAHQEQLVRALGAVDAQILVTGTHEPPALAATSQRAATFHVEPGRVVRLL